MNELSLLEILFTVVGGLLAAAGTFVVLYLKGQARDIYHLEEVVKKTITREEFDRKMDRIDERLDRKMDRVQ